MNLTKAFTYTVLPGLAALTLGLGLTPDAQAKPVLVQRGSHGANFIVDADNIPAGATRLTVSAPGAAAQDTAQTEQKTSKQPRPTKITTRGSHGAAVIVN